MELKADFLKDLGDIANDRLDQLGVVATRSDPPLDSLRRYLTVEHRLVSVRPRETVRSKELETRPVDSLTVEVRNICQDSEAGGDLNHYLSKGVFEAETDGLLNDWGIVHLHLGGRRVGHLSSARSGPLLFAIVTDERFYLIDVVPHGKWSDQSVFEIVHRNWPDLIRSSRAPNVVAADTITDERRRHFREARLNMVTVAGDGTVYVSPGFGQMASGLNAKAAMRADWIATRVQDFQDLCFRLLDGIVIEAAKLGAEVSARTIVLRLVTFGARFVAQEENGAFALIFVDKESLTVAVKDSAKAPAIAPPGGAAIT